MGEIYSISGYDLIGAGASIIQARDSSGREVVLLAFNLGLGVGGIGKTGYAFVSEQPLDDFAGFSFSFDAALYRAGVSVSLTLVPTNVCSATTTGGGISFGTGVSASVSYAIVLYDSAR